MGDINDDDLDGILDSALEDFSAPKSASSAHNPSASAPAAAPSPSSPSPSPSSANPFSPADIMADLNNPEFRRGFEDFMKQIDPSFEGGLDSLMASPGFAKEMNDLQALLGAVDMATPKEGSAAQKPPQKPSGSSSTDSAPAAAAATAAATAAAATAAATAATAAQKKDGLQASITETLNKLKDSEQEVQSEVGSGADPLANLMSMLGGGGTDESLEKVLEGMMGQLMSKEVLYEPMKELATLYPIWLEESKSTMSEEEYKRCHAQYLVTKKIVETYEEPNPNFATILDLMQQMQEYGQPPANLLKKMAPGLEIGADGLPKIPGLNGEQCPVM